VKPPSVSELRKICVKERYEHLYSRILTHRIAFLITRVLIRTDITANQVTVSQIFVGLLGCFLLAHGNVLVAMLGCLLLHFGYVLDSVDGMIARYRRQPSVNGILIDISVHTIVNPLILACTALHYYHASGLEVFLLVAMIVCICKIYPLLYTRLLTIEHLLKSGRQPVEEPPSSGKGAGREDTPGEPPAQDKTHGSSRSLLKLLYERIKQGLSYPNDLIFIALLLLMEVVMPESLPVDAALFLLAVIFVVFSFSMEYVRYVKKTQILKDYGTHVSMCREIVKEDSGED